MNYIPSSSIPIDSFPRRRGETYPRHPLSAHNRDGGRGGAYPTPAETSIPRRSQTRPKPIIAIMQRPPYPVPVPLTQRACSHAHAASFDPSSALRTPPSAKAHGRISDSISACHWQPPYAPASAVLLTVSTALALLAVLSAAPPSVV